LSLVIVIINWLFVGCSFIFLTIAGISIYILSVIYIIITNPILLT
jgi:ABC-type phosphate transport system auxiliary subunit